MAPSRLARSKAVARTYTATHLSSMRYGMAVSAGAPGDGGGGDGGAGPSAGGADDGPDDLDHDDGPDGP
eukprot:3182304-Pyramimonas_sp.AAC.1